MYIVTMEILVNKNLKKDGIHLGELRMHHQYIIIAPSIAKSKVDGLFKQYTVVNDVAPATLKDTQLICFLDYFKDSVKVIQSPKTTKGGNDRSAYDFAKCCELIEKGFTSFSDVEDKMRLFGSSKWRERTDVYREMTFKNALRKVRGVSV